jgi:hypothetical protein
MRTKVIITYRREKDGTSEAIFKMVVHSAERRAVLKSEQNTEFRMEF